MPSAINLRIGANHRLRQQNTGKGANDRTLANQRLAHIA